MQLWCVDSVDSESFYDKTKAPQERAQRHLEYETLPRGGGPARDPRRESRSTTSSLAGASFGAFHALSFATRRPGIARKAVGLSGAYDAARWLGGSREGEAYYVNPLTFLPSLKDERCARAAARRPRSSSRRAATIPNAEESRRLVSALQDKGVPASLHVWDGWAHDWPYWKEMVDVFL